MHLGYRRIYGWLVAICIAGFEEFDSAIRSQRKLYGSLVDTAGTGHRNRHCPRSDQSPVRRLVCIRHQWSSNLVHASTRRVADGKKLYRAHLQDERPLFRRGL